MARPKTKLTELLLAQTLARETCSRFGYNPVEEMIKCAREVVVLKDDDDLKCFGKWWNDWDLMTRPDGVRMLVVKREMRLEVAKAVAPYVMPQLKASENHTTQDNTVTLLIQTFDGETKELEAPKLLKLNAD